MEPELHPLVVYGEARQLSRRETAAVFEINYSTFRQLVCGHTRASFGRAEGWEKLSHGQVKAIDVMRWQKRNSKAARDAAA